MPLPVIEDVFRCAFNFNGGGGYTSINVLHVRAAAGSETAVGTAIFDILDNGGAYNPWTALSGFYSAATIDVIKLDGTSATQSVTGTPIEGDAAGDFIPNAAMCVSLHTAQRGPRGRGRTFVGPICEANQTGGIFTDTYVGGVQAQWLQFIEDLAAATPSMELVVASYQYAEANAVTSVRVDKRVATQRRRLERVAV